MLYTAHTANFSLNMEIMMSNIQNLFVHSLHALPKSHVDFVTSEQYLEKIKELVSTDEGIAKITIKLLNEIALDPLVAVRDELFYFTNCIDSTKITFWIRFHCTSNPLPTVFILEADTDLCRDLVKAIESNLKSKKFKAATIDRRLMSWQSFRGLAFKRYEKRANKAFIAVKDAFEGEIGSVGFEQAKLQAAQAHADVLDPLENHFKSRHQAISRLAVKNCDKGFSYLFADFMMRNLMSI